MQKSVILRKVFLMILFLLYLDADGESVCDSVDSGTFNGPLIGFGLLSPQVSLVFSSKFGIFSVKSCSVANQTYVTTKIIS